MRHAQLLKKLEDLQAEMDRVKQELRTWEPESGEWLMRTSGHVVRRNPSDVRVGNGQMYIDNGTLFPTEESAKRMADVFKHAHRILRLVDEANERYPMKSPGVYRVVKNLHGKYVSVRVGSDYDYVYDYEHLIPLNLNNESAAEYVCNIMNSGKFTKG